MELILLENETWQVVVSPIYSSWQLKGIWNEEPVVSRGHVAVKYRLGRKMFHFKQWRHPSPGEAAWLPSPQGPMQQRALHLGTDENGLSYHLAFALPENEGILLWKLRVENNGKAPVYIGNITLLETAHVHLGDGETRDDLAFYSNGWQSWSYSGVYGRKEHYRQTRLGPFTAPMQLNAGTPRPRRAGRLASDFFGILGSRSKRRGMLVGFLSQANHFGSLEVDLNREPVHLRMWANGDQARLDVGSFIETDWACMVPIDLETQDPLGAYLDAVWRENNRGNPRKEARETEVPVGWCSWYRYFQDISEQIIEQNLIAAHMLGERFPLGLIQIDDGYQQHVGDWFAFKETFPNGAAPLAARIREQGFEPGIWLAPFILERDSMLAKEHPDWLLRNRFGVPVNAGYLWDRFASALDLSHPEALDYACNVVSTAVEEWGYAYLKLDFLYAAALPGRFQDETLSRAQVLRRGLEALREAAGEETTLVGCGCPLGSGVGIFDIMRIGADVAPDWHPKYFGTHTFFKAEPGFPAARNAAHNTLTRAPLHRRWWLNDPDCLLLSTDSNLSLVEVQTLASVIALSGGSLVLSDDLSELPPERIKIAQALLPLLGKSAQVVDWFDSSSPSRLRLDLEGAAGQWHLLAHINWEDEAQVVRLDLVDYGLDTGQTYYGRDFWRQETLVLTDGTSPPLTLPPHGCLLLAVRPLQNKPLYLGSDLHISQGLEVHDWQVGENTLRVCLRGNGSVSGNVDLALSKVPLKAHFEDEEITWLSLDKGIFRFGVEFEKFGCLDLVFE